MVYTLAAKREVVVCAGAFQSPQLLMVSGIGPSETLSRHGIPVIADRPGVGQNMWARYLFGKLPTALIHLDRITFSWESVIV